MRLRLALAALLAIVCCVISSAQTRTVAGRVESPDGTPLAGAHVRPVDEGGGAVTGKDGTFSLRLPSSAEVRIAVSYVGYETQYRTIGPSADDTYIIIVLEDGNRLPGVQVYGQRREFMNFGIEASQMSALSLDAERVKSSPALFGEADVLKTIQKMPGVLSAEDGNAGIHVRGGEYDQNLVTMDGAPVYNSEHLSGFVSIMNPDVVDNVLFYKGAFPARYGSHLSSVVDVSLRSGDMNRYHGQISLGMLSSKVQAEGPLWKGHTSFNVAARASYFNWIVEPMLKGLYDDKDAIARYAHMNYFDLNAKIVHLVSSRDTVSLSVYAGRDKNNESPDGSTAEMSGEGSESQGSVPFKNYSRQYTSSANGNRWSNIIGSLQWVHAPNERLRLATRATMSLYSYRTSYSTLNDESEGRAYTDRTFTVINKDVVKRRVTDELNLFHRSKVADYALASDLAWSLSGNNVGIGIKLSYDRLLPAVDARRHTTTRTIDNPTFTYSDAAADNFTYTVDEASLRSRIGCHKNLFSASAYIEDDIRWNKAISTNIGIRTSFYSVKGESHISVEPRLSASVLLNENMSLKAGYARTSQAMHRLTSNSATTPSYTWIPLMKGMKPATADQLSLGYNLSIGKQVEVSVEGYYKHLDNIVEYRDGASFSTNRNDWDKLIAMGKGDSYGVEFLLEKGSGATTGWLSYTWSRSFRKFDRPGMEVSGGKRFRSGADRPHNLNIVLTQQLGRGWNITASWTYQSGFRRTLTNMNIYGGQLDGYDGWSEYGADASYAHIASLKELSTFKERNGYKLPDVHHLDISLNCRIEHGWGESTCNFSIYNVYNRKNISSVYFGYENNAVVLKGLCRFPLLPSVSYTLSF